MKDNKMKKCKKNKGSNKTPILLACPDKTALKQAIAKSIKKNQKTLKILAKR